MDQLNDALGKLLSDPNAMSQMMQVVQSITDSTPPEQNELPVPRVNRSTALFQALLPFLSPKRQEKLERAMQLAKMSSLASLALRQTEQDSR